MKKILLIILLVPAFVFARLISTLCLNKSLDNSNFNTSQFENNGNPIVISFWATWCKPCILELETINEVYEDWQDETGVKLIAISTDNIQKINDVKVKKDADDRI